MSTQGTPDNGETRALEAQAELGWRWPVQQGIWHDLIAPGDNEWTTWSDAIVITEHVAKVLGENGYVVLGQGEFDELRGDKCLLQDEVAALREALEEAQLRSIEARNPGIDMEEVRRVRGQ